MEKSSENFILESRQELMISKSAGEPTNRLAHFIQPSETSPKKNVFHLPFRSLSKPTPVSEPKDWPLKVNFAAWRYDLVKWKEWVGKMALTHKSTWEKAGIFGPIMSSTYEIRRDSNLVFRLAEKWSPETNTFVFSWGEVTITLEDMMASGYSVLGSPVFSPLETEELEVIKEKLINARLEMSRSAAKKASHSLWLKKFMNLGSEIEHEAFLALWLSRYIFPHTGESVGHHVLSIAIHLARGSRIALAPAVLACIYRDLSLLRNTIVELAMARKKQNNKQVASILVKSPFQLVQIWAWERFVYLQPQPKYLDDGECRLARWDKLNHSVENLRRVLESSKENFIWRPYGRCLEGWMFAKFYSKNEMLVRVDSSLDEELESFARCLRVSPLVGLDFIEWYFPHRVSMQFGYDQDLPGRVDEKVDDTEKAWKKYCRSICDLQLYIPSRCFQANVTPRYAEWWEVSTKSLEIAKDGGLNKSLKSSIGFVKNQKRSRSDNEESKLLSDIIVKSLKQKNDFKKLTKFDRLLKKCKVSEMMKSVGAVSHPSKIPKMSSRVSSRMNSKNGSLTSRKFPLNKESTRELAGSMKIMDGEFKIDKEGASKEFFSLKSAYGYSDASGSLVGPSLSQNPSEVNCPLVENEDASLIHSELAGNEDDNVNLVQSELAGNEDEDASLIQFESAGHEDAILISELPGNEDEDASLIQSELVGNEIANMTHSDLVRNEDEDEDASLSELTGNEDARMIHSGIPGDGHSDYDCNGSKLYQECLKLEARVTKVEEGIKEIKASWNWKRR